MAGRTRLYPRVMGGSWADVAEPLRGMHGSDEPGRARGRIRVERGRHPIARLLTCLLRLPDPSPASCVQLDVSVHGDEEVWHRTFAGRRLDTRQYQSRDRQLAERFGILEFRYRLATRGGNLRYVQREAALRLGPLRVPIPARFAPRVEGREDPTGPGRFAVTVRVVLPAVGLLIAYDGVMAVEDGNV